MINGINEFLNEVELRQEHETNEVLKKAYQKRIDKANSYLNEIMNK